MMLEPWEGRRVVDLFAGSGALGIEALSRGAERVDFVESSPPALAALGRNLDMLELGGRATVWRTPLPGGLSRLRDRLAEADVVLLDPPYGGAAARRTLEALARPGLLRDGCRVVVEHHAKDALADRVGGLERASTRAYGETHLTFYEPRGEERPGTGGSRA